MLNIAFCLAAVSLLSIQGSMKTLRDVSAVVCVLLPSQDQRNVQPGSMETQGGGVCCCVLQ